MTQSTGGVLVEGTAYDSRWTTFMLGKCSSPLTASAAAISFSCSPVANVSIHPQ